VFEKDIDGEITFLTEVRASGNKLLVMDCYRKKRARQRSTGTSPGANVQNEMPSTRLSSLSPETREKSSDFEKIQEKYQSAKVITGDEDEIQIGKEALSGKWKLVEADTPTASHDETTFHKTPGFPTNDDGSTINDRDQ
jgi:hypothetical protein